MPEQKPMKPAPFEVGDYVTKKYPRGAVGTNTPFPPLKGTVVKTYIGLVKKGGARRRFYDVIWDGKKQPVTGIYSHVLKKVED